LNGYSQLGVVTESQDKNIVKNTNGKKAQAEKAQ